MAKLSSKNKGNIGERVAENYLRRKGHKILFKNFTTKFGEVDIISMLHKDIYFFEVKFRTFIFYGSGEESINVRKIKRITNVAEYWITKFKDKYTINNAFVNAILIDKGYNVEEYELI